MIKLFKYIKGISILFAILAPTVMFVEVIMDMMQPTLLKDIINVGVANRDTNYIVQVGLKMLGAAFLGIVAGISSNVFSAKASVKMGEEIRKAVFTKIQTLSFREIDSLKTSSLITRLTNDVTQFQNLVQMGLKMIVRAPFTCIFGVVMAISVSKELSPVFAISIPIILTIIVVVLLVTFPLFAKMQKKVDNMNLVMRENLLGVRVIKSFTMEKTQSERFSLANNELLDVGLKANNRIMIMSPLLMLVINITTVAVFFYGGMLGQTQIIEAGTIMAFVQYLVQIMSSVMMAVMVLMNLARAKASASRINEVLNATSSITEITSPKKINKFDIEFNNVSFKYNENSENVLSNITFAISEGEHVGIIGATGSGKSSLISLIPRLYDVTEGSVSIGGIDVKEVEIKDLRDQIGIVLQESILFQGTIKSNLKFGNENKNDDEIEEVCQIAEAMEFIDEKDDKFESPVEQRAKNLSGGQKQRLSIARTLLRDPKILILDDSTSALDVKTESKLQKSLRKKCFGKTVILIASRISSIMGYDKIIVLDNGKIDAIGSHKELLEKSEIYRSIAVNQLGNEVLN